MALGSWCLVTILAVCTFLNISTSLVIGPVKRILVVGGNGRVGASTAKWLHTFSRAEGGEVELIFGGRSRRAFDNSCERIISQLSVEGRDLPRPFTFQPLDVDGPEEALSAALHSCGS